MAETETVIVEYAIVEEVTAEVSRDAGPVEKLMGEVPVESIPLAEEPEAEPGVETGSISKYFIFEIEKEG